LQIRRLLSLEIRAVLLLLIVLSLADCSAEVWGLTEEAFKARLHEDTGFLRHLDLEQLNAKELFHLGPGAPYYISLILKDLELERLSNELLWLQWNRGKGIWKERAGVDILGSLLQREEYPEVIRLSRSFLRRIKTDLHLETQRIVVEALYWQQDDLKVVRLLPDLLKNGAALGDPELMLFRAVSNTRLNSPHWSLEFRPLFYFLRNSVLQARALSFLKLEQRFQQFDPDEYNYYQAKVLLYQGRSAEAVELLEPLLMRLDPQLFRNNPILNEMTAAYIALGRQQQGAEFLLSLAERLSVEQQRTACELAGQLYRKIGAPDQAIPLFKQVAENNSDPQQRDRALWFMLDLSPKGQELFLDTLAEDVQNCAGIRSQ